MAVKVLLQTDRVPRKRRTYKKSRQGCRNCKIRRVKCDETRPQCQKCRSYRVCCNYSPDAADLQVSTQDTLKDWNLSGARTWMVQNPLGRPSHPLSFNLATTDSMTTFQLDRQSMDLVDKFKNRTVHTLGGPTYVAVCEAVFSKYACSYPFLMHTLLCIPALHDRYLAAGPLPSRRTVLEAYHWSRCTTLLKEALSRPIKPEDRDPLWASAALLSIVAFCSIDASTPEESWPLKPSDPHDLEWFKMSEGKMAVWKLTDPLRPDSIFSDMASEYAQVSFSIPEMGIAGVPQLLIELCDLDTSSTAEDSPYFVPVQVLSILHNTPNEQIRPARILGFIHHMPPRFKTLLMEKDPIALMLTALWYEKAQHAIWWMERRAIIESQAIYLYLQRYHRGNTRIQALLPEKYSQVC